MELKLLRHKQPRGVNMDDKRQAGLQKLIEEARLLNEMLKTDGWSKVLKQRVNARIMDQHKIWLKAKTPAVAETLRLRTSGYEGIFDIITKVLREGENAQIILRNSDNKSE